jgi:glyoxylase-like metal-dependent hydrolase (beta-lactamase superfamily II)
VLGVLHLAIVPDTGGRPRYGPGVPSPRVVPLAPGVYRIPTTPKDLVNSFAFVEDDGQVTLVDCGTKGAPKKLVAALAEIGARPADVTRIVLTHTHPDHAGGAEELRRTAGARVAVHAADAPFARRGTPPPRDRSFWLGRLLQRLPGGDFPAIEVGDELTDGQLLEVAGGLRVVHTPGHSPGHVSLLHEPSGVLVTGDALFNWRGIGWSIKFLCTDFRMSQQTAHALGELEYSTAAFTHGSEIRHAAREQIRGFLLREAR